MRRIAAVGTVVLLASVLVGCTAPETADPTDVQRWLERRQLADAGIGQMAGLAAKTADVQSAEDGGIPSGVRIDLDEPARIGTIEFSCFGAETMDAQVRITTDSHAGAEVKRVRCADGAVRFESTVGDGQVVSIGAEGFNENGVGAWAVAVR
ncbi:hypothetical protein ACFWHT_01680 [Microbacterium sp. NPDC058342]|uniref:hypothetical protein n=1 Tax=Microbacterium sp. NPDC058342 TaxID=3346454 RepID=UPI00366666E2